MRTIKISPEQFKSLYVDVVGLDPVILNYCDFTTKGSIVLWKQNEFVCDDALTAPGPLMVYQAAAMIKQLKSEEQ